MACNKKDVISRTFWSSMEFWHVYKMSGMSNLLEFLGGHVIFLHAKE
jgi:hypothetical protein